MARITLEQKSDAIFRYENGGESLNSIAKSLNLTNNETINFWIKKYQIHRLEAFKKSYTRYTFEDKPNILKFMNVNGLSSLETAAEFNLPSPGTIRKWRISHKNDSVDSLIPKKEGRPKLKKNNLLHSYFNSGNL